MKILFKQMTGYSTEQKLQWKTNDLRTYRTDITNGKYFEDQLTVDAVQNWNFM